MNEEAKDDSSVLGKAVSVATVGGGMYGAHKGATSNAAFNWASGRNASGRGNFVSRGVENYNNNVTDFKNGYHRRKRERAGGGDFVYEDIKTKSSGSSKQAQKMLSGSPEPNLLKSGLGPEALKNQVHLDNLRNATKASKLGKGGSEAVETIVKAL